MGDIAIREYRPGDLEGVLSLLTVSLGETKLLRRTAEWFSWKHIDNPFGASILLIAESDQRIVGLRALMRWELRTAEGDTIRCVRAVDTATHPDYQRRGIFRSLTESALEVAGADGVDMVFNTPNPKSGAGYLKMGWQEVGHIGVMVAPRPIRMARRRGVESLAELPPLLPGSSAVETGGLVDREPMGLRTPRTSRYLAWRFAANPVAAYVGVSRDGATAVLRPNVRSGRTELVVSDVFGSAGRRAIGAARRRSSAAYLVGWFPQGSNERREAVRAGMVPVPRVKAMRLVARPLQPLPLNVGSMSAWDLTMSDLELL